LELNGEKYTIYRGINKGKTNVCLLKEYAKKEIIYNELKKILTYYGLSNRRLNKLMTIYNECTTIILQYIEKNIENNDILVEYNKATKIYTYYKSSKKASKSRKDTNIKYYSST
jgi:hypothetical protein